MLARLRSSVRAVSRRLPSLLHPPSLSFPLLPPPRAFSSSAAPPAPLSEADFHVLADATLASIELCATPLEDLSLDGFDLTTSQGVLTLRLGEKGTYVLNKQAPNRQIWWSSPVSGPRRYVWDGAARRWVNSRDGSSLLGTLEAELAQLTGVALAFAGPE